LKNGKDEEDNSQEEELVVKTSEDKEEEPAVETSEDEEEELVVPVSIPLYISNALILLFTYLLLTA